MSRAAPAGPRARTIRVPRGALRAIARHAEGAYPDECCGALLGADAGERVVRRVVAATNDRSEERARRYLIDPTQMRAIEQAADADGLQVVGFYHSHPDHPARPSAFDREHAWPWYTYVIVPVEAGDAGAARAWRLRDDRSAFEEQEIR